MIPREYQTEAKNRLFDYLANNERRHPLIALPTGSGKSLVMADIIKHIRDNWKDVNILVISHVKEILEQDHKAIQEYVGESVGLYSAGLDSKEIKKITVAGIQSIYRRPEEFKCFDFVIIDECHLISESSDSMYRKFLKEIDAIYLGLTATPFRLGTGYIYGTETSLFDDLIYDLTSMDPFNKLIKDGYLCNLRTKSAKLQLDTEGLKTRAGDFIESELSLAFDKDAITEKAVEEIIEVGKDYKKWLVFAIDIAHAEHIAELLIQKGVATAVIHSKMEFDRAKIIKRYKDDRIKCVVNVNVLTTGFDNPAIDMVALLRPTQSPVLHVQTVGRGLRIFPGKNHCIVLDFAGNTRRIGPINDIHIRKKRATGEGDGEPITKTCPECETIYHPSVRVCDVCGYKFEFKSSLSASAGSDQILAENSTNWHKVDKVMYQLKKKANAPDMIKVSYLCGLKVFNEYLCLDHKGYARKIAVNRIKARYNATKEDLESCVSAFKIIERINKPIEILVKEKGKWPEIIKYKFD